LVNLAMHTEHSVHQVEIHREALRQGPAVSQRQRNYLIKRYFFCVVVMVVAGRYEKNCCRRSFGKSFKQFYAKNHH
jgi:hypothetical protein